MNEILKDLEELFKAPLSLIIVSVLSGVVRTIVSPEKRTLAGYVRGLIMAVFVAFLVSNFLSEYDFGDGMKTFCIAVAAFSADDILFAAIKFTRFVRENPMRAFEFISKILGRK